jgi:hypothetical protein
LNIWDIASTDPTGFFPPAVTLRFAIGGPPNCYYGSIIAQFLYL